MNPVKKEEPDVGDNQGSLGSYGEDGGYEDEQGDLDLDRLGDKVWLVKMPKFLEERWRNNDRDNVDLGWVRVNQYEGEQRIQLVLAENETHIDIPTKYNLSVTNKSPASSYVFEEEILPSSNISAGGSAHGQKQQKQPQRRTAFTGTVAHECSVTPIVDEAYRQVMSERQKAASQPKRSIKVIDDRGGNLSQPGGASQSNFATFIRSNKARVLPGQEGLKNARLPRNELLDLLFECFEKYEYWPLKGLREALKQPETYLKEVLENIAVLQRKGPYDSMWSLKQEYKSTVGLSRQNIREEMMRSGSPSGNAQGSGQEGGSDSESRQANASRKEEGDSDDDVIMQDVTPR